MDKINNFGVIARILLGTIFVVSGAEKLLSPYQNFLYVIQNYQLIGPPLDEWVARIFPWIEFLLGLFCLLGLWLTRSLEGILVIVTVFIGVVGQALIRGLPIDECGCFGSLVSLPLQGVIIVDSCLWLLTSWLLFPGAKASRFSLDEYFSKNS
ncbi:MAG: hypothetical protein A2787_03195 [Omnitrophica WOR_2 bacterium RIFCSPHIGHO2_01_FULL_48_9]|nr:MAG: hypothetical protein A3D10_01145 [Omnitrophica WOR_2 bacterium RIFCSPHIGHO2_02_FULL_48_11]OGX32022.1 MAG: hypothetical protein A2787_03195 [Omnitrophica WOR_2 bacterium RIFCSPHIGHO2_01_FULL_48_9]